MTCETLDQFVEDTLKAIHKLPITSLVVVALTETDAISYQWNCSDQELQIASDVVLEHSAEHVQ